MHNRERNYFYIILFCCFLFPILPLAQLSANDSSVHAGAVQFTIKQYHQFISNVAPLYNGPQYVEYDTRIHMGHPYFQSPGFNPASIMYDDILYEGIPLKYDLVKNEVVIKDPSGVFRLSLSNDKISHFKILDHTFIRILRDSNNRSVINTGFYDVLYKGINMVLLKKETKKILEDMKSDGFKRSIEDNADYYIARNNTYYSVNTKGQIFSLFKDRKNEVKKLIHKNKLNFRLDRDSALITIASYYDTLTR